MAWTPPESDFKAPTQAWTPPKSDFALQPPGFFDLPIGVARGLAGVGLGASQLATDLGFPTSPNDPIERRLRQFSQGGTGADQAVGKVIGGALPAALSGGGPLVSGFVSGLEQPTKSGTLKSHLESGAIGAVGGKALSAIGGSPAAQAIRKLGVRLTPGRMLPLVGREWERFTQRLPILNRLIGHGRQVSLDDFNRALYADAWQPIGGKVPVTATGDEGLEQLRTAIAGRLNRVLAQSSLPDANVPAFTQDMTHIAADAVKDLNPPALQRLGAIMRDDVGQPIVFSMSGRPAPFVGRAVPGSRLAGPNGIIAHLNHRSRQLWRSQDSQDRALASYIDRIETTLLDHADIGGGGRPALDAARNAYARYKTLSRAASGLRAEGNVDPDSLLGELKRQMGDQFRRARLYSTATQARRAGVPTTAETHPEVSPWETAFGIGGGLGLEHYLSPERALAIGGGAVLPSLLYNRPMMSIINALARYAPSAAPLAGSAAGQLNLTGGQTD